MSQVMTEEKEKGAVLPVSSPESLRKAQDDFEIITTLLLSSGGGSTSPKTFYAHFLMRMNIVWDKAAKYVQTAGVNVTDKINLYIYPEFFNKLDVQQKIELLEHEIEHIIYLHPLRSKDYIGSEFNQSTRKLFNLATDANINEGKAALTRDMGVTIDRLNEQLTKMGKKDRLVSGESSEQHYQKLRDNAEVIESSGMGTSDDHGQWKESTENEELVKGMIQQAANEAKNATGAGNCPNHIVSQIEALNKANVNWKSELRRFFINSLRFNFERTRSRRNRRYGLLVPGKRKKPELNLVVIGDESGSMCDASVSQIFSEIDAIFELGVGVTYIAMDAEVSQVVEYKKGMKMKRTASGGTYYSSGINKAKELKPDAIVLIGDMDSADKPEDPKIPFLWVTTTDQKPPGDFGRTIKVEVERKR